MSRHFLRLFLPLASLYVTGAVAQEKPADSKIFIFNVTVINTETGKEVPHRTVVVSDERIAEVKDSNEVNVSTTNEERSYSYLSATIGSTRIARRAGM